MAPGSAPEPRSEAPPRPAPATEGLRPRPSLLRWLRWLRRRRLPCPSRPCSTVSSDQSLLAQIRDVSQSIGRPGPKPQGDGSVPAPLHRLSVLLNFAREQAGGPGGTMRLLAAPVQRRRTQQHERHVVYRSASAHGREAGGVALRSSPASCLRQAMFHRQAAATRRQGAHLRASRPRRGAMGPHKRPRGFGA